MPDDRLKYVLHGVNPTPWMASLSSRVGGKTRHYKPAELEAYQSAIRDALDGAPQVPWAMFAIDFYFWRSAGTTHDHQADATNLQKSTEDALQGVLFNNDRDVRRVQSTIVKQGPSVVPLIVIEISEWEGGVVLATDGADFTYAGPVVVEQEEDFDPEEFI